MRTFKLVNNFRNKVRGNRFLVFEQRIDGVRVSEYEPKDCFRVAAFKDFVQFVSCVKAREAVVGEANVMEGRFFRVRVRPRGDSLVEEGSDIFVDEVQWIFIVLKVVD